MFTIIFDKVNNKSFGTKLNSKTQNKTVFTDKNGQHMQRLIPHIPTTISNQFIINKQIIHLQFRKQINEPFPKRITYSNRFRHDVEKLKIDGNNMYKLILPVEGERSQVKVVESKFIFSYADMSMSPECQFTIEDMTRFPIIDVFEPEASSNPQIYHKIVTDQHQRKLMKYYNFNSFTDYAFKAGLYQLSLYKTIQNSHLSNYFVLFKGQSKQIVMIFDYCYVSLHDMLYYRKMAGYEWEENELLIVAKMICQQMVQLAQIDVVHRDIRPSNIFFVPLAIINSGQHTTNNRIMQSGNLINESINGDRFYALFNFESARMVDRAAFLNDDDEDDIFTVKGSSVFTEGLPRDALLKQQHKANYNPFHNDIVGLKNTLYSMVNLQPTNVGNIQNDKLRKKPKLQALFKYMSSSQTITIEQVSNKVNDLIGINPVNKPDSYYTAVRNFYIKELTICQNIQTNLYFSNPKKSAFSLMPQASTASIDSRNAPRQQPNPTLDYIESLYIKTLSDLHKKDTFVTYMLEKLGKNFENNRKQQNVSLLMKVGQYFEDSGVRENQYYKEAILLLTELAEDQRVQGFYKDHERLVDQAEQVYAKFSPQSKAISRAKCMFLKEKAYRQMLLQSQFDFIKHILKGLFPNIQDQLEIAQNIIFQAYEEAQKANLSIEEQLELIYAKGQLSMYANKIEEGENFFFNGYQIAQKNYKEFLTAHNCSKYKGMFEYAVAMVEMVKIRTGIAQRTPKIVFQIQQKLQKAKQRFSSVKIHPVHVIKCYLALGDLADIREDGPTAIRNYERALNLLHAENQTCIQQGHTSRAISARVQVEIVAKLIDVLNMTNHQLEANKYEQLYQSLKRDFNLARRSQNSSSRKSKSKSRKDKQLIKQETNNLAPIEEVEEENKMFESKSRALEEEDEQKSIRMKRSEEGSLKDNDHVSEF